MNKLKAVSTALFIALAMLGSAQQWNIAIDHHEIDSRLKEGCCTVNNETIFVGYWDTEAFAIKIDEQGNYTQKVFSTEDRTSRFHSIIPIGNGNYFVTGVSTISDIEYLWVLILDNDMNKVKEQFYEKEDEYSVPDATFYNGKNCKSVVDDDGTIVVCVGVCMPFLPQTYRIRPVFMRFNTDCERLNSVFIASDAYGNMFHDTNFELNSIMNAPDNSDVLVVGPGQGNCQSIMRFDYDFTLITHHIISEPTTTRTAQDPDSDFWIDNNNILLVSYFYDTEVHNKAKLVYGKANIYNGIIYENICINKTDTLNYTIGRHSMCTVNDTTMYLVSLSRLGNWAAPANMEIYLTNKNLEILGSKFFYNDTGFWPFTAIATKDDGIVAVSTSLRERTHIKKLLREDFNPILCSVSEVPKERLKAMAFPNPTKGELNIDISNLPKNLENRVSITDVSGMTRMCRIIQGSGNLLTIDVLSLEPGAYLYSVYNKEKELFNGKFVKE